MKVSEIDIMDSSALEDIIFWGFGGLKVVIGGLYDKAGEVENADLANQIHFHASLLESHAEAVELKLHELVEEKYRKEVTA